LLTQAEDAVAYEELRSVDKYMTIRFNQLVKTIRDAYVNFEFLTIYKALVNFINVDLSAFYLDFAKDVVYIEGAKSLERRQMQTVFYDILVKITKLLTPILPHTAEEIWSYLEFEAEDFVQLSELPEAETFANQEEILDTWSAFMDFRGQAQKALEEARNEKVIGKSLEAHLTVYPNEVVKTLLGAVDSNVAQLLIVSELTIAEGSAPEGAPSLLNVQLVKFVTVAVVSIQQLQNATTTQPSVITVQALSKRTLRTQLQKDLKQNNKK